MSDCIKTEIGTPARPPKPRGKSTGWKPGKKRSKRTRYPVGKKGQSTYKKAKNKKT
ncbi:hypothetical protein [Moorena sp. SIO3I8]|uniref:hypothetical protein n=1 Tax=Moorena sp. SIO3I8 TaxID=2607833 RepID=UPI0013C0B852|nr:hypothetical protein [Moorena sp. SIO3I8]NEO10313.1 hypothetical protein [Moorena sp. SIO3I8]